VHGLNPSTCSVQHLQHGRTPPLCLNRFATSYGISGVSAPAALRVRSSSCRFPRRTVTAASSDTGALLMLCAALPSSDRTSSPMVSCSSGADAPVCQPSSRPLRPAIAWHRGVHRLANAWACGAMCFRASLTSLKRGLCPEGWGPFAPVCGRLHHVITYRSGQLGSRKICACPGDTRRCRYRCHGSRLTAP